VYKTDLVAGKEYTFKVGCGDGASANFDSFIEVWDSAGVNGITNNDDACEAWTSSVTWIATQSVGFVVVRGFDASKYGNFTLSCKYDDPAPSTCKTPPLFDAHITWPGYTLGTWINDAPRTIGSNSCFVYKVDLVIGKEYDFKVGCGNGATADFDTFMEVWDSAGTGGIVNNDDGCEEWRSSVTWTASESVAYVVVKGFNSEKYGTYTLACMYDDGKKSAPLSINNNIQDAISIYPNPADQIIRINASAPFSFEGVSLSDFTGRVIRNWNLDSQENYLELQISDLNNGTYFLTVRTSDGLVRKKVVINR